MNEVSDGENDDIEIITSLAFHKEIDVALSTSFNFDDPDNLNGADQNVAGNNDNANNSTETTQRSQLTRDRLFPCLESALNKKKLQPSKLANY